MSIQEELENINKECSNPTEMKDRLLELLKKYPNEYGILFNLIIVDCAIDEANNNPKYLSYIKRMKSLMSKDYLRKDIYIFHIVRFYYLLKDYKNAKKYLLKIIDNKMFIPETYGMLSEINVALGEDLEYSLDLINKAMDYNIDNDNNDANEGFYFLKGDLLANLNRWDELKEYSNRLLILSKDPLGPRFYIIRCLVEEYKNDKSDSLKEEIRNNIIELNNISKGNNFLYQYLLDMAKFIKDYDLVKDIINNCSFIEEDVKESVIYLNCFCQYKSQLEKEEYNDKEELERKKEGLKFLEDCVNRNKENNINNPYTRFSYGSELIEYDSTKETALKAIPYLSSIVETGDKYNIDSFRIYSRALINAELYNEAFDLAKDYYDKFKVGNVLHYESQLALALNKGYDESLALLDECYKASGINKIDYINEMVDLVSLYKDKERLNLYKNVIKKSNKNDLSLYGIKKGIIDQVYGIVPNIYSKNVLKKTLFQLDTVMNETEDPCLYSFIGMYLFLNKKYDLSKYYFKKGFEAFNNSKDQCLCPIGYYAYSKILYNNDIEEGKNALTKTMDYLTKCPGLVSGQYVLVLGYYHLYYGLDVDKELLLSYLKNDYYFRRYDLARYYLLCKLEDSNINKKLLEEALNNSNKYLLKYYKKHYSDDKFIPLIVNS